jgi:hypothetical protein
MTTPNDCALHAAALTELVARHGVDGFFEYTVLESAECAHQLVALHLAGWVISISDATGFDLAGFIASQRDQVLQDETGGTA